jgi:hypothetical protein
VVRSEKSAGKLTQGAPAARCAKNTNDAKPLAYIARHLSVDEEKRNENNALTFASKDGRFALNEINVLTRLLAKPVPASSVLA